MGKIQKGILGGFSDTVGTVVGATWRGLDIMRSRPKKTTRIPTPAQAEQRARFLLMAHFLRPIRSLLAVYFGQPAGDKSRSNLATSYHMTEAIAGVFPAFTIDYQKAIISRGELLGLQQAAVAPSATAILRLSWIDNSGQAQARSDDAVLVAVYNESRNIWQYRLSAELRSVASFNLSLPDAWVGDTVHCYVAIASADNHLYSNSEYFGPLVLL